MPKNPRPTGKEIVSLLKREGWALVHIRGSHHVFEKGPLRTSVPVHGNQELRIGTFFAILEDMKISRKDFIKIFKNL